MSTAACCVQPHTGACPAYNILTYMEQCDTAEVGSICEGDGECGTSNSLNNCQTWDVYTRILCPPPPPPQPPFPPASPAASPAASADANLTQDGCPELVPEEASSCPLPVDQPASAGSGCNYDLYCCPGGGHCSNLTTATCTAGTWQVVVNHALCLDALPFVPPAPPSPPPPSLTMGSALSSTAVFGFAFAAASAIVAVVVVVYVCMYRGTAATASIDVGSDKPLLARSLARRASCQPGRMAASSAATLPPWTFRSLNKR